MTQSSLPSAGGRLHQIGPVLLGATSFACANVLGKFTLTSGADVLTLVTVRSWVGLALLSGWIVLIAKPAPLAPRHRWLSWLLGILFTGNVFFLFKAIEAMPVPVAVLTYFIYPMLTGLAAAATGLDKISWRGALAALVAFGGLALMIGVHPGGVALAGVVFALAGACCRVVMLLVTRAKLTAADPRLLTWHTLVASTLLFTLLAVLVQHWQPPVTTAGWIANVGIGMTSTFAILFVYVSTVRIGPFRTALFMNLEPLLSAIGAAIFLGEVLTPLQLFGGAIILAALVAFQLRR